MDYKVMAKQIVKAVGGRKILRQQASVQQD